MVLSRTQTARLLQAIEVRLTLSFFFHYVELVEIWGASMAAVYTSSVQQSYRGAAITDASGTFSFKTVLPAAYLNENKYRPKHLHIEVWAPGTQTPTKGVLVTQYYFKGDSYISADLGASKAESARILDWTERTPVGKIVVRPTIIV
jgi:protocatechuate 3,4-dioxygenase beta subunit